MPLEMRTETGDGWAVGGERRQERCVVLRGKIEFRLGDERRVPG